MNLKQMLRTINTVLVIDWPSKDLSQLKCLVREEDK